LEAFKEPISFMLTLIIKISLRANENNEVLPSNAVFSSPLSLLSVPKGEFVLRINCSVCRICGNELVYLRHQKLKFSLFDWEKARSPKWFDGFPMIHPKQQTWFGTNN
jgi:hypothetical protein